MSYYKKCECGEIISAEFRTSFPKTCGKCNRKIVEIPSYSEEECPFELNNFTSESTDSVILNEEIQEFGDIDEPNYALRLSDGSEIQINSNDCFIGREYVGADELTDYPSVSRKHIHILVRGRNVMIKDLSTYGTYVNGERLNLDQTTRVSIGDKVTLCNIETTLIEKR